MENIICPFTGLQSKSETDKVNILELIYENNAIGKIRIASTFLDILNNNADKFKDVRIIIAGLSRQHYEKYKTPFEVNHGLLENGYKEYDYPKHFEEKANYLLKYFCEKGGCEYEKITVDPHLDFTLGFAKNSDEFLRLLTKLEDEGLIRLLSATLSVGTILKVELTKNGIEEIKKDLPRLPMLGLVDQSVITGDQKIDEKIIHAKKLFFSLNATKDDKRSACETLSFVLEPIREDLKKYFQNKDIEDFFQIVNTFDIRHNKKTTKLLEHEEQLEWIFYSLLNTITCYIKLKDK